MAVSFFSGWSFTTKSRITGTKKMVVKYKRKQHVKKALSKIEAIKNSVPKIVFKANNLIVTLKNKKQLSRWLEVYPEGTYVVNY